MAVITGAASGLGRALAVELARRGYRLALIDLDGKGLEAAAAALAKGGADVSSFTADVASEAEMTRAAGAIVERYGAIDLLINNAGISISTPFQRIEAGQFERVLRVNFFGAVHGCRAFLSLQGLRAGSQIVNVSSCFAWTGYPGKTAYAASKAAVRAFSECLRLECASAKIGVTVLYPGPLYTNIVAAGITGSEEQRAREDAFLRSRGLPLDRVAKYTVDALEHNPCRIVIGSDYRWLDALARLSPALASWAVGKLAARAGF